jgi:hypothetical protein
LSALSRPVLRDECCNGPGREPLRNLVRIRTEEKKASAGGVNDGSACSLGRISQVGGEPWRRHIDDALHRTHVHAALFLFPLLGAWRDSRPDVDDLRRCCPFRLAVVRLLRAG